MTSIRVLEQRTTFQKDTPVPNWRLRRPTDEDATWASLDDHAAISSEQKQKRINKTRGERAVFDGEADHLPLHKRSFSKSIRETDKVNH